MRAALPGPWFAKATAAPGVYVVAPENGRGIVATVNGRANADKVAAAHELYTALAAIGAMPNGYCFCFGERNSRDGSEHHDHTGECWAARAALARAEGL